MASGSGHGLSGPLGAMCGESLSVPFQRVNQSTGTFFVPDYAAHRPAAKAILNGRLYEPATHALVAAILQARPGNMIHAGAFFGDMLPSFSRACTGTVYAFEPVLENYLLAKLCIEANGLDNVMLLNAGLGPGSGTARIDTGGKGGPHLGGASTISEQGQVTALLAADDVAKGEISVLQLDVEGYEREALQGATRILREHHPIVMIEDETGRGAQFLQQVGYRLAGQIPGLSIWQDPRDDLDVPALMQRPDVQSPLPKKRAA